LINHVSSTGEDDGNVMEPVQIGVREIYDLLMLLDSKMDAYTRAQAPQMALFEHRLTTLEDDRERMGDRRWIGVLALISSLIALVSAFVAPLVVH